MESIEIIKLAREMRTAQKEYFRTRTTTALTKARRLEKDFDKAVGQFFNPSKQLCFDNFNTQPFPSFDIPLEPLNP